MRVVRNYGWRPRCFGLIAGCLSSAPALAAEPPVLPYVDDAGMRYDSQTWILSPAEMPAIRPLTIAESYSLWRGEGKDAVRADDVRLRCAISPAGMVEANCDPVDRDLIDPAVIVARNIVYFAKPAFARYPVFTPAGGRDRLRFVEFSIRVDPATKPAIDLSSGELVPHTLFETLFVIGPEHYPSRAMRDEAEGQLMVECQVQTDRSLICRTVGSAPPAFADYFPGWAERYSRTRKVPERLYDGRPSAGKRTRVPIDFKLAR